MFGNKGFNRTIVELKLLTELARRIVFRLQSNHSGIEII
ncbi:hypothetical protein SAMN05444380_11575 [Thermophagus xiamenensis]|uniref:Uncharacterized protein n=1 Tax=Thermophagus xiamenensis TaxID=385682 RepID=A0A1I2CA54_9BACT|nr:hypothetical protein SAMN05444380_11575 [Thermophagus xiamenensis]